MTGVQTCALPIWSGSVRADVPLYRLGLPEGAVGASFDVLVDRLDLADVAADGLDGGLELGDPVGQVVGAVGSLDRFLLGQGAFDGREATLDGVAIRFGPGHASRWSRPRT